MDITGLVSLELAFGSIIATLTAAFIWLKVDIKKVLETVNGAQARDEKILEALSAITLALKETMQDHKQVQTSITGLKVRDDRKLELLSGMKDHLVSLTKDHEKSLEVFSASVQRTLDAYAAGTQRVVDNIEHLEKQVTK